MSGKFLLDTNVLILSLSEGFIFPENNYIISIITEIELLSFPKLNKEEEKVLRKFLTNFKISKFS